MKPKLQRHTDLVTAMNFRASQIPFWLEVMSSHVRTRNEFCFITEARSSKRIFRG